MTLTLELTPKQEARIRAEAQAIGLEPADYVLRLIDLAPTGRQGLLPGESLLDACLTEAMHLLYHAQGWLVQNALWSLVRGGVLFVWPDIEPATLRAAEFINKYRDLPCDYADATLLVAAEDARHRQVFTLDQHFFAYCLSDGTSLEVIRSPSVAIQHSRR